MSRALPKASFVPTKKQLQIIKTTAVRWGHTLFEPKTPDLKRIAELLNMAYANRRDATAMTDPPRVYVVYSPLAFFVAQAVIRGVLSKEKATQVLQDYGVDPEPVIKPLRRDTLAPIINLKTASYWQRKATGVERLWLNTFGPLVGIAMRHVVGHDVNPGHWRTYSTYGLNDINKKIDFSDLPELGRLGFDAPPVGETEEEARPARNLLSQRWNERYGLFNNELYDLTRAQWPRIEGYNDIGMFSRIVDHKKIDHAKYVDYSNPARETIISRTELISPADFGMYGAGSIIDAEVSAKIAGIKTPAHTWSFELLHEASAVMTFGKSALVLVGNPTIRTNADNELHCDTGPAVEWEDGASLYLVDGHGLGWAGRMAVCAPKKLTVEHVDLQSNEETRRVLIECMGWDKYLGAVGAKVLDRRENWVDNTIELLIEFQREVIRNVGRGPSLPVHVPDRRLVLACRSTGRKYFIAVPQEIRNCEQGQTWLAGGAQTEEVPALRHAIRVIGAS